MRKIRKFSVSENASVLSAEEMRRISGGNTPTCRSAYCYAYDGITRDFLGEGQCGLYNNRCTCNTTNGGHHYGVGECTQK